MNDTDRQQRLNDVRLVLDWLEQHADIPLPYDFHNSFNIVGWDTKEEAGQMARAMGTFEKDGDDNFLYLTKKFGCVAIKAIFSRTQVCERAVIGTKLVPETIVPARIEPEHEEELVEWRCESLLEPAAEPTA